MRTLIEALEVIGKFLEETDRFMRNEKIEEVRVKQCQEAKVALEEIKTRLSWMGITKKGVKE